MQYLSLDYGQKRIGLATADEKVGLAFPLVVIKNDPWLFKKLRQICQERGINKIVLGLPVGLNNQITSESRAVESFAVKLKKQLGLAVVLWDERFTTQLAQKLLEASGHHDAVSASLILQSYLASSGHLANNHK